MDDCHRFIAMADTLGATFLRARSLSDDELHRVRDTLKEIARVRVVLTAVRTLTTPALLELAHLSSRLASLVEIATDGRLKCEWCGAEFSWDAVDEPEQSTCPDCRSEERMDESTAGTQPLPAIDKVCIVCHAPFVVTRKERKWFAKRPWLVEPARCRSCRAERRALREAERAGA